MSTDPLALGSVVDLLNRSRALQRATAAATADARAAFARQLAVRAALGAEIADLRWADGCRATA
jgi:hypothetical protein